MDNNRIIFEQYDEENSLCISRLISGIFVSVNLILEGRDDYLESVDFYIDMSRCSSKEELMRAIKEGVYSYIDDYEDLYPDSEDERRYFAYLQEHSKSIFEACSLLTRLRESDNEEASVLP